MKINYTKTKGIHFRNRTVMRSMFQFKCGESIIEHADKYKYLGLVLNQHPDDCETAKYAAQSATRALGLLIPKYKQTGGMPFDVFKKLFDTTEWSVISYGAAIWGIQTDFSVVISYKAET